MPIFIVEIYKKNLFARIWISRNQFREEVNTQKYSKRMTSICRRNFWSYEVVRKSYFTLCFVVNSHFVQNGERCSREHLLAALRIFSKKESFVVRNHESNIMRTSHIHSWFSQLFYLRLRQLRGRLTARLWMTK